MNEPTTEQLRADLERVKAELDALKLKSVGHYCVHHNDAERADSYTRCPVCLKAQLDAQKQNSKELARTISDMHAAGCELKAQLDAANRREAKLREAINQRYPERMASNANAISFHIEEGEPFAGIGNEALAKWIKSVGSYCTELHAALQPDAGKEQL